MMRGCERILVVEDERTWQDRIASALASVDCLVEQTFSHGEALIRITREPFDLVVVDLHLHGVVTPAMQFEGEDILATLRERGLHSIVLTNFALPEVNRRIARNYPGVYDIIPKHRFDDSEFEKNGFADLIREVLQRVEQASQAEGLSEEQLARLEHLKRQ